MYCLPGMVRFSCFIDVLQGFTAILYVNISIANSFGESFSLPLRISLRKLYSRNQITPFLYDLFSEQL